MAMKNLEMMEEKKAKKQSH